MQSSKLYFRNIPHQKYLARKKPTSYSSSNLLGRSQFASEGGVNVTSAVDTATALLLIFITCHVSCQGGRLHRRRKELFLYTQARTQTFGWGGHYCEKLDQNRKIRGKRMKFSLMST